jgi:hypothetical protein
MFQSMSLDLPCIKYACMSVVSIQPPWTMVTRPTTKIHRARAQLTAAQKIQRRVRQEELAGDIDTAKQLYETEAVEIAQKHGR